MTSPYAQHMRTPVPQSEPVPGKPMVQNAAGGFVFALDDWKRLRRFLILGTEGGSYYESERKMTLENADVVKRCALADGKRTVEAIVEVSDRGLAVKNDPAIFALAMVTKFGDADTRRLAYSVLEKVCRIGTHLFQFAEAREAIGGGWGRGLRQAVARWYARPDLVTQALKYQQRNGWSHRDLLRLAHPKVAEHAKVFNAICRPEKWAEVDHDLVVGWRALQEPDVKPGDAARIISAHKLPRELVPTQFLTEAVVWEALLPHMPMHAMVRNLGNLSKCGLLAPLSDAARFVCLRLADASAIRLSRLHPFSVLIAARTYAKGAGVRGSGSWTPVPQVIAALDGAYDLAFFNVEPTGKRFLLGIDVSGSMSSSINGVLSAAEAAAAMAMVTVRTERECYAMGFSQDFVDLGITPKDSLVDVLAKTRDSNFGGTDTTVAVRWALQHGAKPDAVVIYSDGETWAGHRHTFQAMEELRRKTGLPVRLAVVNFTATGRSIADQQDPLSMDFVGMDASLPQALSAFVTE